MVMEMWWHGSRRYSGGGGGETPENRWRGKPFALIFGGRCTPTIFGRWMRINWRTSTWLNLSWKRLFQTGSSLLTQSWNRLAKYDNLQEEDLLGAVLRWPWSWCLWQGSWTTSQRNYNRHWPWEICWHGWECW